MQWEPDNQLNEIAGRVIGAAIEVHRTLGPGLNEIYYQLALEEEFKIRSIPHSREYSCPVVYKGLTLGSHRLDFLVENLLVVELKSVEALESVHYAQTISYLKLTRLNLGLLINFNVAVLKSGIRRIVLPPTNSPS